MIVTCPTCGEAIPAEDVNVQLAIAKCAACNVVFDFADQVGQARAPVRDRDTVPMPKGVRVEELGSDLTISWRWWRWSALFLLFFCIIWDGFLIFWYGAAFTMTRNGFWPGAVIMVVFPILHVAVGVGLTYSVLCYFFNTTVISVQGGVLRVRHGPLPWRGNREIEGGQIEQIYCKSRWSGDRGPQMAYEVYAVLADNSRVRLLSRLDDEDQALFIEQIIERHLRIEDRPVRGELGD